MEKTIDFLGNFFRSWWHVAVALFVVMFCVMFGMLIVEYRYFKHESKKMIELQTEYKNHIMATKRLLQGSSLVGNQGKEEAVSTDEKKNDDDDEEESFIIVNRGLEYAKDVTCAYYKKKGAGESFARIPGYEWVDYTDWVIGEHERQQERYERLQETRKKRAAQKASARAAARAARRRARTAVFDRKIFSWPIEPSHFWVSSLFGPRRRPNGSWGFHYGLDMAAVRGTPVRAAASGIVIETNIDRGYGKTILLSHDGQYQTRYAHLDAILVKEGQMIERGQLIGRVGKTGHVRGRFDGSHLHFEVSSFGKRLNPLPLLH